MADLTVLHVLEAVGGGTSRHLLDIVTHVKSVSHEVAIPRRRPGWLSDETLPERLVYAGARVHMVEMRRRPYSRRNVPALFHLWQLIQTRRPDIVHGHAAIGGALGRIAATARGARRIYSPHGIAPGLLAGLAERSLVRVTDYFVADSPSEGEVALRSGFTQVAKLRVIPNGIDIAAAPHVSTLRNVLRVAPDVPLVGTLARLDYQKDPLTFVRLCSLVARKCQAAHFVLIGDGRLQQEVLAQVEALMPSGRFHYLPDLREAPHPLGALSVFVSTSRYEGGPYTPIDAMHAQVPVVLSDCVGNRDVAANENEALSFPVGDAAAGATAVLRILSDSQLRYRMIVAAALRVRSAFDVRSMVSGLEDLYMEAASKG
jgi:glycosyltransferase involved in cell wall biosynthesis